jgi:hypothetical protein
MKVEWGDFRLEGSLSALCELLANCCGVLNFASAGE